MLNTPERAKKHCLFANDIRHSLPQLAELTIIQSTHYMLGDISD